MAHELRDENSMAYVGDKPWHGWGIHLRDGATIKDFCNAIPMLLGTVEYQPVTCALGKVPDYYAVCLMDPNGVQEIVGCGGKQLAQSGTCPRQLIQAACDVAPLGMDNPLETAGFVMGRSRAFLSMPLGQKAIGGNDRDLVRYFLNLTAGFDGSWSLIGQINGTRVVCHNTASLSRSTLGANKADRKVKATKGFSLRLDNAKEVWTEAIQEYQEIAKIYDQLAATKVSDEQAQKILAETMGANLDKPESIKTRTKNILDKLFDLYQQGQGSDMSNGSLWGVFNAVTEYADHHSIVRGGRDSDGVVTDFNRVMASTMFGSAADLKQTAFDACCKAAQL